MKTIRHQLTRKLLLTVGLLLGAGVFIVYVCARTALQGEFDAALRTKAEALATLTGQKGGRLEMEFSDERMRGFEVGGATILSCGVRKAGVWSVRAHCATGTWLAAMTRWKSRCLETWHCRRAKGVAR
jgi:hypothetical protein